MFVRAKSVGGRRYLYLVKGTRDGRVVRQRTVCYLGPLSKLASGVPKAVRAKAGSLAVDWGEVNARIREIPLTFEELSEARRAQFGASMRARGKRGRRLTMGAMPRVDGELAALTKASGRRFADLFEETGPLTYQMR